MQRFRPALPILIAAAALIVLAALASLAFGRGIDEDRAVAKVGDEEISKQDFSRWLNAAAKAQQPAGGGAAPTVPDPPDYENCIQAKQRQPTAPGAPKPNPDAL